MQPKQHLSNQSSEDDCHVIFVFLSYCFLREDLSTGSNVIENKAGAQIQSENEEANFQNILDTDLQRSNKESK